MKSLIAMVAMVLLPAAAQAVPVTYSYTGQLVGFESTLPGIAPDLASMMSSDISGWVMVDLDAEGIPVSPSHPSIFGYGHAVTEPQLLLRGEGFEFTVNQAGEETWHAVHHTDDPSSDSVFYGEQFSRSNDSLLGELRTLSVDFIGHDLLGVGPSDPKSLPNPAAFEAGAGRFAWWTFDADEIKQVLMEGVFTIDSMKLETMAVPEPGTALLMLLGIVLLMAVGRREPLENLRTST